GYVASGRMGMQLFPRVESDYAFVSAVLPVGAPEERVRDMARLLTDTARETVEENGGARLSTGVYTTISGQEVQVRAFLAEAGVRPISTAEFTRIWREKTGDLPGLESLSFMSDRGGPGSGAALTVELSHRSTGVLDEAAARLAEALDEFPITKDIDDGSAQGKMQFDFTMKPLGYTLGLTTQDVARQVRAAFFGSEVFKQQ